MLKEVISKRCYYVSLKYDPVWCNGSGVLCSVYHYCSCEFKPIHGEVYSIHHYMIKFVSDLRQDGGFLWILQFASPLKLTAMI